jgi:hypothetical protein
MKMTPKMTIDALRLMKKHPELIEDDWDDEDKQQLQSVAGIYLSAKAAGKHGGMDFPTWYENADISELDDEEDEAEADPTASKKR